MSRRAVGVGLVAAGVAVLYSRRRAQAGAAGVVGAHLSEWVPPAPQTRASRLAATVWAAPVSAVGLVLGAAAGTTPRRSNGVLLFAPAAGLTGRLIRLRGYAAMALGHVVIATDGPSAALLAHELVHVRQAERLGPLFLPVYLVLLAVHGYGRHPLERAARLGAAREQRPLQ